MCEPISNNRADAVQGGIRIASNLDRPWLRGSLRIWVAGVEDQVIAPQGLVGANMAFRRVAAEQVGGFDIRLGPGAAGFFDDTVFGWELQKAGFTIVYLPDIAVEHHFSPDRLELRSYLLTAKKMAASNAIVIAQSLHCYESPILSPSIASVLLQLPGFLARCATQFCWILFDGRPDAGFVVRYYQLCLWLALRKAT
jgi:hypothetical protein